MISLFSLIPVYRWNLPLCKSPMIFNSIEISMFSHQKTRTHFSPLVALREKHMQECFFWYSFEHMFIAPFQTQSVFCDTCWCGTAIAKGRVGWDPDNLVGGLERFYFSIQLGMSSSQQTNSYFSEGFQPPTSNVNVSRWISELCRCFFGALFPGWVGTAAGWTRNKKKKKSPYPLVNIQKLWKIHPFSSWVNPLFLWPFSIANC